MNGHRLACAVFSTAPLGAFRACVLAASIATLLPPAAAHAGNTWDGGGGSNLWSNPVNWSGDTTPSYGTLTFSGSTQTTNTNDFVGYNTNNITFNSASAFTLNGSSTVNFFDNGGVQAKIENQGAGLGTINFGINFAATTGAGVAEINAVTGDLVLGGAVTTTGSQVASLDLYGTGRTVTFNGAISGTGKKLIVKGDGVAGTGNIVILNAANSYTGNTEIDRGTLQIGSTGSLNAASAIFAGNGTITNSAASLLLTGAAGGQMLSSAIQINPGAGFNRTLGGTNTSGTNTFSGTVALQNGVTLTAEAGGTVALTSVVSGAHGLTKVGLGTLTLGGASTYTGATAVNAGELSIASGGAIGAGSSGTATTVNSGGTLRKNGILTGTTSVLSGGTLTGNGVFNGNVTIAAGGTHNPGNSPGRTIFNANYDNGGTVSFEVEGITNNVFAFNPGTATDPASIKLAAMTFFLNDPSDPGQGNGFNTGLPSAGFDPSQVSSGPPPPMFTTRWKLTATIAISEPARWW